MASAPGYSALLTPLVIADIMRGTGRYNLAQGAIATMAEIGASLSGIAAGEIVDHFRYAAAFLALGAAALVASTVFAVAMPETAELQETRLPDCRAPPFQTPENALGEEVGNRLKAILNLIMNAIEAMSEVRERSRELLISTRAVESDSVLVAVSNSGPGLPPARFAHISEPWNVLVNFTDRADIV